MLSRARRHWWVVPVGGVVVFFGLNIWRTVRSPSPALARTSDEEAAQRQVRPEKGEDRRWPRRASGALAVGNGVVEPRGEVVQVSASVPGRITAVRVKEGQQVKAGQILAELEDETERASLAAARAEEAMARAELARVLRGSRVEERAAAKAAAARAEAKATMSRGVYQRTLAVHRSARGAVALDQLERARQAAEADEQAARQARAELDRVLNGARAEDRSVARARLSAAQARVERAKAQLTHRKVVASLAGEVLRIHHRPGEYYVPGEGGPLLELGDTRHLRVRMEVDERDIGKVKRGAPASIEAPAYPTKRFSASVVQLGRRMGRKQILSGEPAERLDVNVLEVLLELKPGAPLVVGQRVVAYVHPGDGD